MQDLVSEAAICPPCSSGSRGTLKWGAEQKCSRTAPESCAPVLDRQLAGCLWGSPTSSRKVLLERVPLQATWLGRLLSMGDHHPQSHSERITIGSDVIMWHSASRTTCIARHSLFYQVKIYSKCLLMLWNTLNLRFYCTLKLIQWGK